MNAKEYRGFLDKSEWGPGAWQDEPDKVQWTDETTGLPCLVVRGPHGSFCGYVGVLDTHPWHGKDYGQCTNPDCKDRTEERTWCDHTAESILTAHGGITFAAGCTHATREQWQEVIDHLPQWAAEARVYPHGDAARRLKVNTPFKNDYEGWHERQLAVRVCHLPAPGEPDNVWWFGFDCAHAGDYSPAYDHGLEYRDGTYRDLAYVQADCRALAAQLAAHAGT